MMMLRLLLLLGGGGLMPRVTFLLTRHNDDMDIGNYLQHIYVQVEREFTQTGPKKEGAAE